MSNQPVHHHHHRSFFWPVILLGVGIIWLLTNLNIIPSDNLWILLRLWPVLIIVAGLDVLFSRRLPVVGAGFALLVIAGVVLILLQGDRLNLEGKPEAQTETFIVDIGNTTAVNFDLALSTQDTVVTALPTTGSLVEAQVGHYGRVEFTVTGAEHKWIRLEQRGVLPFIPWILPGWGDLDLDWEVALTPEVPFNLSVDASTGRSELDLQGLQISRFEFDGGTGSSIINLAGSQEGYEAHIDAGTGSLEITFPSDSNLTVNLRGSTGRIHLAVPEDQAVKIEVLRGGTGDLHLPGWITRVSGGEGRDEGVYQSVGFEDAAHQLVIVVENIRTGNIFVDN